MADTPINWCPLDSSAGLRLRERLCFMWAPYTGAGALTEIKLTIYADVGKAVTVWDSGLVGPDGVQYFDGSAEVWAEDAGLASATQYWWAVTVRDDVVSTSTESTLFDFTMETAPASMARIGQAMG